MKRRRNKAEVEIEAQKIIRRTEDLFWASHKNAIDTLHSIALVENVILDLK